MPAGRTRRRRGCPPGPPRRAPHPRVAGARRSGHGSRIPRHSSRAVRPALARRAFGALGPRSSLNLRDGLAAPGSGSRCRSQRGGAPPRRTRGRKHPSRKLKMSLLERSRSNLARGACVKQSSLARARYDPCVPRLGERNVVQKSAGNTPIAQTRRKERPAPRGCPRHESSRKNGSIDPNPRGRRGASTGARGPALRRHAALLWHAGRREVCRARFARHTLMIDSDELVRKFRADHSSRSPRARSSELGSKKRLHRALASRMVSPTREGESIQSNGRNDQH